VGARTMSSLRGCGGGEEVIRQDLTPRAFLLMEEEVLVMPLLEPCVTYRMVTLFQSQVLLHFACAYGSSYCGMTGQERLG
jgi:hypothetical protein